ncbi:MAG: hypothetical protein QM532_02630 [Cyanobium sp. MAG06]|nr:hypothetical protein [Cyanobium sp. MAG06]
MELITNSLGAIGFDWHIAIVNFINFCIIFFILKYFFWNKISKLLEERRDKIEQGIKNMTESENILSVAKKDGENILLQKRLEADDVYNKIIQDGKSAVESMESRSIQKYNMLEEDLNNKLNNANQIAMSEFQKSSPQLLKSFIIKQFSKNMSESDNNIIVNNLLK